MGGLGQASASAVGLSQLVDALASAVGGQAGPSFDVNGGPSGVALANATATGLATAQALAQTEGGGTSTGHATARQLGYQQVDAGSTTQADLLARSNSFAARELAMYHDDASTLLAASGSGAVAIGDPGIAAQSSWLDGNPNVQAALGSAPVSGLGLLRVDSSAHHVESFAQFDWEDGLGGEHLVVGFLDPELGGAGFDALHVEIDANGQIVFAQEFATSGAALAGLDDFIVEVPFAAFPAGKEATLRVMLSATLSGVGSSFGADFALWAVPEPASAGLIAVGALLLLAFRVRR